MFKICLIKFLGYAEVTISVALVLSCIYIYVTSPQVMCKFVNCRSSSTTIMSAMFPRAVAMACMLSRLTVMYKNVSAIRKYGKKIRDYGLYYPVGADKEQFRWALVVAMGCVCVVIIVPINAYRLYLLYDFYRDAGMVVFFLLMYVQNGSMCLTEIQFIAYCLGLCQMLQSINEELSVFKARTIITNRYPLVLKPCSAATAADEYSPRSTACKSMELLKMRHQFVSDAIDDLNDLYSSQLGLSLTVLFVMTLFDIYEVVSTRVSTEYHLNKTKSDFLFYGWLIQYAFRFCTIILTTHATTKQAHKSKSLITDINYRYLDHNTKEELRLFLDQLSSRSMEFTTFDFFTLNTRLITSAIVAGTTYLVVMLQIN